MKHINLTIIFIMLLSILGNKTYASDSGNLDVTKLVGSWQCIASIDINGGVTFTDYMKGQVLTVNLDGTYSSTSSDMGRGTYTIRENTFTAKSTSGRSFTATVTLNEETMVMEGKSSDGIKFKYTMKKIGTGISDMKAHEGSDAIYDLNGRRVDKLTKKGVYIKDGKKYIITQED